MTDYLQVINEFVERALPRYLQGHQTWGDAREHHSLLWWLDENFDEVVDNVFYLVIARYLARPPKGHQCIYIAGPCQHENTTVQTQNLQQAREAMIEVYRKNHIPFSPISMTAWLDKDAPDIPRETYLTTDLVWLKWCQGILLLPGWELSQGALLEREQATKMGLEIYYSLSEIPDGEVWEHEVGPRQVLDDAAKPTCWASDPGSIPGGSTNDKDDSLPPGWEDDESADGSEGWRRYYKHYGCKIRAQVTISDDQRLLAEVLFWPGTLRGEFKAEYDGCNSLDEAFEWCDEQAGKLLTVINKNCLEDNHGQSE